MNVSIDTTITFDFTGNRSVTVEAWDFDAWRAKLFTEKGKMEPIVKDGEPVLDAENKPREALSLSYEIIAEEMAALFREKHSVEIKPHEAKLVWDGWDDRINEDGKLVREGAFTKKKRLLDGTPLAETLLTSPASTDPRSWE